MKYLRLYEDFAEKFYEFDAIEFYKNFKQMFNLEKNRTEPEISRQIDLTGSELFELLDDIYSNWRNIPINSTAEQLIKYILENKEVDFFDLGSDLNNGKVKYVNFNYSLLSKRYKYEIDLYEAYNEEEYSGIPHNMIVNQSYPVKVYGEQTEIEKYVELFTMSNKYNIL